MTPGQLELVQPTSDRPRAGNVYLLRGFIGIWSYGVDHLGQRVNESGVRAQVYQQDQSGKLADAIIAQYKGAQDPEPLIIIGHSYGADDALRVAKKLAEHNLTVDLIVTLDPVTPPKVPANVKFCYNIYQPNMLDSLPFFRGIALESEAKGNLQNVNIRSDRRDLLEPDTDHFNIEKNTKIHAEIVKKVAEFCPPRQQWVAGRRQRIPLGGGASAEPVRVIPTSNNPDARRAGVNPVDLQRVP